MLIQQVKASRIRISLIYLSVYRIDLDTYEYTDSTKKSSVISLLSLIEST